MQITPPAASIDFVPTPDPAVQPPPRWSRWWTSPIARVDYGANASLDAWHEAGIPAERGLTGDLRPSLLWGGTSRDAAIEAARLLASQPVDLRVSVRGRLRTISVNPAIAVLRDARAGAFWLAPLHTTMRAGRDWIDAPHTIDGLAFEGDRPLLRQARVLSATRDMVAVVGRDTVVTPTPWSDAPHDSRLDEA